MCFEMISICGFPFRQTARHEFQFFSCLLFHIQKNHHQKAAAAASGEWWMNCFVDENLKNSIPIQIIYFISTSNSSVSTLLLKSYSLGSGRKESNLLSQLSTGRLLNGKNGLFVHSQHSPSNTSRFNQSPKMKSHLILITNYSLHHHQQQSTFSTLSLTIHCVYFSILLDFTIRVSITATINCSFLMG